MMICRYLLFFLCWGCFLQAGQSQEIDFGEFSNATVSLTQLSGTDLDFGIVISGDGNSSIPLANSQTIAITGAEFLDVILTVDADQELLLDGNIGCQGDPSCSIPFTLKAAYSNLGVNSVSQARFMNITSNSATEQFAVLRRTSGPPGPPPTPPNENFDPSQFEETAYLYIYGSINVGEVDAGTYTGQITVSVVYD